MRKVVQLLKVEFEKACTSEQIYLCVCVKALLGSVIQEKEKRKENKFIVVYLCSKNILLYSLRYNCNKRKPYNMTKQDKQRESPNKVAYIKD